MSMLSRLVLLCTILVLFGCRTRPELGSGYAPRMVQEFGHDEDRGHGQSDDPSDLISSANNPASMGEGWEIFDGGPPTAGEPELDEVPDRRWGPIYFAYNQSFIGETERIKLEQLAEYLVINKKFHVIIEGHCDKQGSEEFNRVLGEKRALAVRDYMTSLNVDPGRIKWISYGEDRPIDPGDTEEAHARNRRAEFIIGIPKEKSP